MSTWLIQTRFETNGPSPAPLQETVQPLVKREPRVSYLMDCQSPLNALPRPALPNLEMMVPRFKLPFRAKHLLETSPALDPSELTKKNADKWQPLLAYQFRADKWTKRNWLMDTQSPLDPSELTKKNADKWIPLLAYQFTKRKPYTELFREANRDTTTPAATVVPTQFAPLTDSFRKPADQKRHLYSGYDPDSKNLLNAERVQIDKFDPLGFTPFWKKKPAITDQPILLRELVAPIIGLEFSPFWKKRPTITEEPFLFTPTGETVTLDKFIPLNKEPFWKTKPAITELAQTLRDIIAPNRFFFHGMPDIPTFLKDKPERFLQIAAIDTKQLTQPERVQVDKFIHDLDLPIWRGKRALWLLETEQRNNAIVIATTISGQLEIYEVSASGRADLLRELGRSFSASPSSRTRKIKKEEQK